MLELCLWLAMSDPLLDLAQAASAELHLETVLRLHESGQLAQKSALLDAERRLPEVEIAHPLAVRFGGKDEVLYRRQQASIAGADRLSLHCRLVQAMRPLDPQAAREMFARLGPPQFKTGDCSGQLSPMVGRYRTLLSEMADAGQFEEHLRGMTSIAVWNTFAELTATKPWSTTQRALFLSLLVGKLETLPLDYGALAMQAFGLRAAKALNDDGVLAAFRERYQREMKAPRCADLRLTFPMTGEDLPLLAPEKWLAPTNASASAPASLAAIRRLRLRIVFGDGEEALPLEQRLKPKWERDARQLINALGSWRPARGDDPVLAFHVLADAYQELLQFAPAGGEVGRLAARASAEFLAGSPLQSQHPAHWLLGAEGLLHYSRQYGEAARRRRQGIETPAEDAPNANGDLFLEALAQADSVNALLLARLEQRAPKQRH